MAAKAAILPHAMDKEAEKLLLSHALSIAVLQAAYAKNAFSTVSTPPTTTTDYIYYYNMVSEGRR